MLSESLQKVTQEHYDIMLEKMKGFMETEIQSRVEKEVTAQMLKQQEQVSEKLEKLQLELAELERSR